MQDLALQLENCQPYTFEDTSSFNTIKINQIWNVKNYCAIEFKINENIRHQVKFKSGYGERQNVSLNMEYSTFRYEDSEIAFNFVESQTPEVYLMKYFFYHPYHRNFNKEFHARIKYKWKYDNDLHVTDKKEYEHANNIIPMNVLSTLVYTNGNYTYMITWDYPMATKNRLVNYNIVACIAFNDLNYVCRRPYGTFEISVHNNFFSISSNEMLIFALITKYESIGPHMTWAKCIISINDINHVRNIRPVLVFKAYEKSIWLKLSISCYERIIFQAFTIKYTAIIRKPKYYNLCNGLMEGNVTFNLTDGKQYFSIENLNSYQNYKLDIFIHPDPNINISHKSYAIEEVKTLEGLPLAPMNLSFSDVKSSTVSLEWSPQCFNGLPLYYDVYCNQSLCDKFHYKGHETSGVLGSLNAFTTYEIHITACNNLGCSFPSNLLLIKTSLEAPESSDDEPTTQSEDRTILMWNRPIIGAGQNILFYALNISNIEGNIYVSDTKCTLTQSYCDKSQNRRLKLYVQAISIERNIINFYTQGVSDNLKICEEQVLLMILGNYTHSDYTMLESFNCPLVNKVGFVIKITLTLGILLFVGFNMFKLIKWIRKKSINIDIIMPHGLEDLNKTRAINSAPLAENPALLNESNEEHVGPDVSQESNEMDNSESSLDCIPLSIINHEQNTNQSIDEIDSVQPIMTSVPLSAVSLKQSRKAAEKCNTEARPENEDVSKHKANSEQLKLDYENELDEIEIDGDTNRNTLPNPQSSSECVSLDKIESKRTSEITPNAVMPVTTYVTLEAVQSNKNPSEITPTAVNSEKSYE